MEEEIDELKKTEEDKVKTVDTTPLLEEAKEINKKKEELLDREEKLQARKEKLHAEEMVAGKGTMQDQRENKEETDHEYRVRIQKEMAEGKTEFGN